MIQRTAITPAGEEIELLADSDVRALLSVEGEPVQRVGMMLTWSDLRRHMLGALFYGGAVHDQSGRASTKLLDQAIERGLSADTSRFAMTNALSSPAVALCVARDNRGRARRTFSMWLTALPESWYLKLLAEAPSDDVVDDDPPTPSELVDGGTSTMGAAELDDDSAVVVEPVVPELEPAPRPVLEVEIANSVATAMLTQVVEIIAAGTSDSHLLPLLRSQIVGLEDRLGQQVGYVDKLRRQLRDAGDEISALRMERDGLRQRARTAEYNLSVATGADAQRIIDAEVRRQLDRIMRQAPGGEHSKAVAVG